MFAFLDNFLGILEDFFSTSAFTFIGFIFLIIMTVLILYIMRVYEK